MSTIKASSLGPLTASNTATIVDPATPAGGSATLGPLVSFASVSASGTNVTFTGIPSWAKRITFMVNNIQKNGSSGYPVVQIGSGSLSTSGYTFYNTYHYSSGAAAGGNGSSGFGTPAFTGNANVYYGHWIITHSGSNLWVASANYSLVSPSMYTCVGSGSITLGGTLDRVSLYTGNSGESWTSGTVNCFYE